MLYIIYYVLSKFFGNNVLVSFYRKLGMTIGENTHIFSKIVSSEPFMISIGSNTTISTGVTLLTHDASVGAVLGRNVYSDVVGPISIGHNCFIGAYAVLLYGIKIPDRSIIAAGTVVTKTVCKHLKGSNEENRGIVFGGNPARFICYTDELLVKRNSSFLKLHGQNKEQRRRIILDNKDKWIIR